MLYDRVMYFRFGIEKVERKESVFVDSRETRLARDTTARATGIGFPFAIRHPCIRGDRLISRCTTGQFPIEGTEHDNRKKKINERNPENRVTGDVVAITEIIIAITLAIILFPITCHYLRIRR